MKNGTAIDVSTSQVLKTPVRKRVSERRSEETKKARTTHRRNPSAAMAAGPRTPSTNSRSYSSTAVNAVMPIVRTRKVFFTVNAFLTKAQTLRSSGVGMGPGSPHSIGLEMKQPLPRKDARVQRCVSEAES